MTWFKVDDKLHDHPKVRKLRKDRLAALGLWTACGAWSADNLSDGFVPAEIVTRYDRDERLAQRLVDVGLWERAEEDGEEGYRFHQWAEHQPSRDEVLQKREDGRRRQKEYRQRRAVEKASAEPSQGAGNGTSDNPTNGSSNALRPALVTATPTRPDPTRVTTTSPTADASGQTELQAAQLSRPAKPDPLAGFEDFWREYPRKVGKDDARKAWQQKVTRPGLDPSRVTQAAVAHARRWQAEDRSREYVPHPSTWLRRGSYDDELPTEPPRGPRGLAPIPDPAETRKRRVQC